VDSGTKQLIIPNWMPSSYPGGRARLIPRRTSFNASRRFGERAARYSVTVHAGMPQTYHDRFCRGNCNVRIRVALFRRFPFDRYCLEIVCFVLSNVMSTVHEILDAMDKLTREELRILKLGVDSRLADDDNDPALLVVEGSHRLCGQSPRRSQIDRRSSRSHPPMDFRVEITGPAIADLAEIVSSIAQDNPRGSEGTWRKLA
jgi:hypothetical protein